ncbi:hypothetical protein [Sphingosinicella sp. CPCC 101087]|uniref:hypothetical protein n=1 Tax=Sphingosinicella sp. CPCC 101087 TaxID=2497754 RepID=UPI00101B8530|nr:hypothetical protein [Sphingosinicella sp. CPCC 101087]
METQIGIRPSREHSLSAARSAASAIPAPDRAEPRGHGSERTGDAAIIPCADIGSAEASVPPAPGQGYAFTARRRPIDKSLSQELPNVQPAALTLGHAHCLTNVSQSYFVFRLCIAWRAA